MKKSKLIKLSTVFASAIVACNNPHDQWINGNAGETYKDTTVNGGRYRYYHNNWYPVYRGMINPGRYNGYSLNEISSPSFHPSVKTGGFGSSAHFSAGE